MELTNWLVEFINWLYNTAYSTWLRESPSLWAYPIALILHSVGMGTIIGLNVAIDLCILGVVGPIALAPMERFFPVMWFGFGLNGLTGLVLLIADPKFLTNWDFLLKLGFIALGLATLRLLRERVFRDPGLDKGPLALRQKLLAGASIFFWAAALTAGRMTAYLGGGPEGWTAIPLF
jgi:hypothetical protein